MASSEKQEKWFQILTFLGVLIVVIAVFFVIAEKLSNVDYSKVDTATGLELGELREFRSPIQVVAIVVVFAGVLCFIISRYSKSKYKQEVKQNESNTK